MREHFASLDARLRASDRQSAAAGFDGTGGRAVGGFGSKCGGGAASSIFGRLFDLRKSVSKLTGH